MGLIEIDPGNVVVCAICNEDFTDSIRSGGGVYRSRAVCPDCMKELRLCLPGQCTSDVTAVCKSYQFFADFVREYRR